MDWGKHAGWRHRTIVRAGVLLALALLVCAALYQGLVTRLYRVETEKLASGESIRIVLLTDLHDQIFGKNQEPLIKRVRNLAPDMICLVGDIVDDVRPHDGTALLLRGISGIAPCFYVTGNHEYWGVPLYAKQLMRQHGVTVLEGESAIVDIAGVALRVSGVDDPDYTRPWDYEPLLAPFENLPDDLFNLLLCHRPDPIETISRYGFDLVLSGHAHGGQARVPFLINGVYAPDQGWFPKYAGGLCDVDGTKMIVSRGLALYDGLPRVFNPPEVIAIDLVGKTR